MKMFKSLRPEVYPGDDHVDFEGVLELPSLAQSQYERNGQTSQLIFCKIFFFFFFFLFFFFGARTHQVKDRYSIEFTFGPH